MREQHTGRMRPIGHSGPDGGEPLAFVRLGVDVPYEQGWELQRRVHARRAENDLPDICLMQEHAPVYTAGKRTAAHERPTDGTPVIDVDRGGRMTWHGPGQLVAYPIIRLPESIGVEGYVRLLEDVLIQVCADFGVRAGRVTGRSGIWAGGDAGRGLGAVGIRVTKGVTMHGFALNCANDPSWFDRIVPCGIADAQVTSLSAEAGRRIVVDEVMPYAEKRLAEALGAQSFEMHEEDILRF